MNQFFVQQSLYNNLKCNAIALKSGGESPDIPIAVTVSVAIAVDIASTVAIIVDVPPISVSSIRVSVVIAAPPSVSPVTVVVVKAVAAQQSLFRIQDVAFGLNDAAGKV